MRYILLLALGCMGWMGCAPATVPMGPQKWLNPPTPRPSLEDVVQRTDQHQPSPTKRRSPVLPVSWENMGQDVIVIYYTVEPPAEEGGAWTVYAPSHRVQVEVVGQVESADGLVASAGPIGTEEVDPAQSVKALYDAEWALVDVAAGRLELDAARGRLLPYLDWLEAKPYRKAAFESLAPGFFEWLRAAPVSP